MNSNKARRSCGTTKKVANRISQKQKEKLIELVKEAPDQQKTKNLVEKKLTKENWISIAEILNSMNAIVKKDWNAWKETWNDMRQNEDLLLGGGSDKESIGSNVRIKVKRLSEKDYTSSMFHQVAQIFENSQIVSHISNNCRLNGNHITTINKNYKVKSDCSKSNSSGVFSLSESIRKAGHKTLKEKASEDDTASVFYGFSPEEQNRTMENINSLNSTEKSFDNPNENRSNVISVPSNEGSNSQIILKNESNQATTSQETTQNDITYDFEIVDIPDSETNKAIRNHEAINASSDERTINTSSLSSQDIEFAQENNTRTENEVNNSAATTVQITNPGPSSQKNKNTNSNPTRKRTQEKISLEEIFIHFMNKKCKIKEEYYTKKLLLMERDCNAKEKIASSLRLIVEGRSDLL